MRKLLDMSSQRIIKILDTVFINNHWITISELSKIIGASKRTVSEDIHIIKTRWGASINIEISPKKGIIAHNINAATLSNIYTDIFNESTALLWLKEILFNPNKNIEFYSNKLFVSESTLIRLLPTINHFLAKNSFELQKKLNRYSIVSKNEQNLRQFYACFLIELYGINLKNIIFDINTTLKIVKRTIENNIDLQYKSLVSDDFFSLIYYTMFYYISLIRENHGYSLPSDYAIDTEITSDELSGLINSFPNISKQNIKPIHEFIAKQTSWNSSSCWDTFEEKSFILHEIDLFFDRTFSSMNYSPNKSTYNLLQYILISAYITEKNRQIETSMLFDRTYYFSLSLKLHNKALYELIDKNLSILSKNINCKISINNVLYWMCLYCPEVNKPTTQKTSLIISDLGMQHSIFLSDYISEYINNSYSKNIKTTTASLSDISAIPVRTKYDIIITTIPNLPISDDNIVLINDYPSQEDLFAIYKLIYN